MTGCTAHVLTSLGDIERLRGWETLTARPPASLTGSPEWVRAAYEELPARGEPLVVAAERDGVLVGIVSLAVERTPSGSVARFAGDPLNDLADALVDVDEPDAAPVIARALEDLPRYAVSLDLNELDPAGRLASAFHRHGAFALEDGGDAPTIALNCALDPAPARLKEHDRLLRRLRERHRVRFAWTPTSTLDDALTDLLRLRAERFAVAGRTASLPSIEHGPEFERFLGRVAAEFAPAARCAIATLWVDESAAARDLYLLDSGVALLFLRGFSPAWRRSSCGHLLLRWCIDELVREGYATLDLGRGDEPYKYRFGAAARRLVHLTATAPARVR